MLTRSEQEGRNAVKIDYDPATPFSICAGGLTPLYAGSGEAVVRSPYCGAAYAPRFKGTVCVVDNVSAVGTETLGLVCSSVQVRSK